MIVDASAHESAEGFFHRATNGRWKAVLSEAELAQYDDAVERKLTAECRRWLELAEYAT